MSSHLAPDSLPGEITIHFHLTEIKIDARLQEALMSWLKQCAESESFQFDQLDYVLSNDEYILQLNKEFLEHDYYTDILTFPMDETGHSEIYISLDRVKENASAQECTFENELARVMVHGILHLSGHSDKTAEDQKEMRAREDHYLKELSLEKPA